MSNNDIKNLISDYDTIGYFLNGIVNWRGADTFTTEFHQRNEEALKIAADFTQKFLKHYQLTGSLQLSS